MKKIFIIFFTLFSFNSFSQDIKTNFTIELFEQAQNNGKTVIVHSWNKFCMTCAKQKPVLVKAEKDFKNIVFLSYEQTKHKDIAKYLEISYWSTIVVFKNNKEVAREIGLYDKDDIYSLIKKGI